MTTRSPIADRWLIVTLPSGIVAKALCSTAGAYSRTIVLPRGAVRGSDVGPEGAPTPHELASRALLAARCNEPPERWYIVVDLPPGAACDYADASEGVPAHESYGQAIRRKDGTWAQPPRGKRPVLLAWRGAEK